MKKLLFEIGTEELPANYMPNILKDLKTLALKKLQDARVPFEPKSDRPVYCSDCFAIMRGQA